MPCTSRRRHGRENSCEMPRGNHARKVATGDMQFAKGRDAQPGDRGLPRRLHHRVKVIEDAMEIGNGAFDDRRESFRVRDHIQAEVFRAAPGGDAIEAGMVIGVADQVLAATALQGRAGEFLQFPEIGTLPDRFEVRGPRGGILQVGKGRLIPGGDLGKVQGARIESGIDTGTQIGPKDRERLGVESACRRWIVRRPRSGNLRRTSALAGWPSGSGPGPPRLRIGCCVCRNGWEGDREPHAQTKPRCVPGTRSKSGLVCWSSAEALRGVAFMLLVLSARQPHQGATPLQGDFQHPMILPLLCRDRNPFLGAGMQGLSYGPGLPGQNRCSHPHLRTGFAAAKRHRNRIAAGDLEQIRQRPIGLKNVRLAAPICARSKR